MRRLKNIKSFPQRADRNNGELSGEQGTSNVSARKTGYCAAERNSGTGKAFPGRTKRQILVRIDVFRLF